MNNEARIEKVENGYIVRVCGKDFNIYSDTYVYSNFLQVVHFLSMRLNEPVFQMNLERLMMVKEGET
jgi:hypothetical protein